MHGRTEEFPNLEEVARRKTAEAGFAPESPLPAEIGTDHFYANMETHSYLFIQTRRLWPAASVNSRIPPIDTGEVDRKGNPIFVPASLWLDQNRPIEQMTWAPGMPELVRDRLVAEGGWVPAPGRAVFNLYRPPRCEPGIPSEAQPWLDHLKLIYPDDVNHIVCWLAHRVQFPGAKINHALVLGGHPGIGKDTLLYPALYAIGWWNFAGVNPMQLLGRFNGYLKSVILRVDEARDLGEINRYGFYEHLKVVTAAPPDVLRVDEKNLREYVIPNVCGVVITTNYLTDGLYLPPDDRRHYLAWSDLVQEDFSEDYFDRLYKWFDDGGNRHVAAYLRSVNLSDFNPKAPPKKTDAFWSIANANQGYEQTELADLIDEMEVRLRERPPVLTLKKLVDATESTSTLRAWLEDRRNRRVVPKHLERVGYVRVPNPDARDGYWVINHKRQSVFGRKDLSPQQRIEAAKKLVNDGE